jgi:hypothetical protein
MFVWTTAGGSPKIITVMSEAWGRGAGTAIHAEVGALPLVSTEVASAPPVSAEVESLQVVAPPAGGRARKPRCEDCFFHQQMLCALEEKKPCPTFRPAHPDGLRPPRQLAFVFRQPRRTDLFEFEATS